MKILVSGSLAYDKIMNFPGYFKDHILQDKIHNLNVSFVIKKIKENFGGTAGNIAYNLALLEEQPVIFSTAGYDFTPYKNWLKKWDIDINKITIINKETTAVANIITDQADNQITAFYPGAMDYSCRVNLDTINNNVIAIIAPGCIEDMINLPNIYAQKNIPFIFDPGQQVTILSKKDLRNSIKKARIFISNDYELSLVEKKTGWDENKILKNVEILVTTLGSKGSLIKTKKTSYQIKPAKPKNTSDPTGAGDAYRAGFIKGLIKNWPLKTIGQFAGVVACYTVEKYGTQTHQFNLEQVKQRYLKNFNIELPN